MPSPYFDTVCMGSAVAIIYFFKVNKQGKQKYIFLTRVRDHCRSKKVIKHNKIVSLLCICFIHYCKHSRDILKF